MIGRVGIERLELIRILHGAEFGDIESAVGIEFDAQHVVDADFGDDGAEQVRTLGKSSAHQQASVATPENRKMRGRGVFLVDQKLSAGKEVVEDILLVREIAGFVPFFAVFGATAEVCVDVDAALIEPNTREGTQEKRFLIDAVAAISVEQSWIVVVEAGVFAADDIQGNTSAVFGNGEGANHFRVVELHGRGFEQAGPLRFPAGSVKAVPGRRFEVGGSVEKNIARADGNNLSYRRNRRQRWRG